MSNKKHPKKTPVLSHKKELKIAEVDKDIARVDKAISDHHAEWIEARENGLSKEDGAKYKSYEKVLLTYRSYLISQRKLLTKSSSTLRTLMGF